MSKAVLVLDMPESCDMCNFTNMVNGKMYCGVPGCGELAEDYIMCRPDWCPLRPMPEKATEDGLECYGELKYMQGWNDCRNVIGGGDGDYDGE